MRGHAGCCSLVSMNSGQHPDQDVRELRTRRGDTRKEVDHAEAMGANAGPLERSQEAIDQGREAARGAEDTIPDDEDGTSASLRRTPRATKARGVRSARDHAAGALVGHGVRTGGGLEPGGELPGEP